MVVEGAFADLANVSNDAGDDDMDSSITSVEFRPDCDAYYSATMGVEWDLDGNGSFETTGPDVDFSAATLDGPLTASVPMRAVHPTDLRAGNATATVGVTNVAPAITTVGAFDPTGAEIGVDIPVTLLGLPVTVEASFTDPGVADTQTAAIDWNDGTVDPSTAFDAFSDAHGGAVGTLSHAHVFTAPGTFSIQVTVTDDDGGTTTATVVIEVLSPADALELVLEDLDGRLLTATGAARRALLDARDAIDGHVLGAASDGALDLLASGQLNAAMRKLVAHDRRAPRGRGRGGRRSGTRQGPRRARGLRDRLRHPRPGRGRDGAREPTTAAAPRRDRRADHARRPVARGRRPRGSSRRLRGRSARRRAALRLLTPDGALRSGSPTRPERDAL